MIDLGCHLSMYNIDSDYMFSSKDTHCSFCTWLGRILTFVCKGEFVLVALDFDVFFQLPFANFSPANDGLINCVNCVCQHVDKRGSKLAFVLCVVCKKQKHRVDCRTRITVCLILE